jgi:High potential iron-sulfur protein
MKTSRRNMLRASAAAPLLLLGLATSARAADAVACFDLDSMPSSQKNLRKSLGFKPQSTDPKKHCGICNFFTPSEGDCGKCTLLSGGPVSTGSVCNSWVAKS